MTVDLVANDLQLLLLARVAERRAEEEAVELGLGQRERAFVLDRVLGREQDERLGQPARLAVDRDLALRHRLEQRRLGLRHRPVDLVDEQDVGEHRAGPELEVALLLVEDREAGDVGRLQVGRALDARELDAVDRAGDGAGEDGLRGPGHVLEQDVALAGERGDDEADLVVLAVHDRGDIGHEASGHIGSRDEPVRLQPGHRAHMRRKLSPR